MPSRILCQVDPVEFQHLDLEPLGQPFALGHGTLAPDEHAGVAARLHVPPLDVQEEVLVLFLGPHHADRVPAADEQAVADGPGVSSVFTLTQPERSLPLNKGVNCAGSVAVPGRVTNKECCQADQQQIGG